MVVGEIGERRSLPRASPGRCDGSSCRSIRSMPGSYPSTRVSARTSRSPRRLKHCEDFKDHRPRTWSSPLRSRRDRAATGVRREHSESRVWPGIRGGRRRPCGSSRLRRDPPCAEMLATSTASGLACERTASRSAAHHLVHWIQGGATDLSNLILLCHRHHWMVHEGGWKLARSDDGRLLAIPPMYDYYRVRAPDVPAA